MSAPSDPPLGSTAVRPSWQSLPSELRTFLDCRLGTIETADIQSGGFTPGLAVRIRTDREQFFVKAIREDHVLAAKYGTEALTASVLPISVPAPRLHWHGTAHGWVVLVFDDIAGRHPDLSPGSSDVAPTVAAVASLADALTPSPLPDAPAASVHRGGMLNGWAELLLSPPDDLTGWERRYLASLADLEADWVASADGPGLIHGDIRPDNMLVEYGTGAVMIVDWAQPYRGSEWQDVTDLIPHMIMAGHPPEQAEKAVVGVDQWDTISPAVITSYAAAYAGYWSRSSRLPAPTGVPHLRGYQRRASAAALQWVAYRTGW